MHAENFPASRRAGRGLRLAGEASLITNTQVSNDTTATGSGSGSLQEDINNTTCHADLTPIKARINKFIDIGAVIGDYTDAVVAAATTVNGLANVTQSDPGKLGPCFE